MRMFVFIRILIGAAATIIGGVLAVGLAGAGLARESAPPATLDATVNGVADTPQGQLPHAFLNLETWPDSMSGTSHGASGGAHPGWVSYGPSTNLSVPAHALVTVTIKQYDTGERIANPYFARVHGTVDGTMTVDGKTVAEVDPEAVAHTFTVHAMVNDTQQQLFVSVPLPAVDDNAPKGDNGYAEPHVITFSFVTNGPGEYVWQCEFPCGDGTYAKFGGPMSTMGYMAGTFTVKANA
jgi:hypothetical protein